MLKENKISACGCPADEYGYKAHDFEQLLYMINGKWKLQILFALGHDNRVRYNELKRVLIPITHKMLSTQLKALEQDGLINRCEYPQLPPKVEYSLSQKGMDFKPVIQEMCVWMQKYVTLNE